MKEDKYRSIDYVIGVIKRTLDNSIPYISQHNAFLITVDDWSELANIAFPHMRKLDALLKKQERGEQLTQKEIEEALRWNEET